ncbi:MAG: hypothetical protein KGQ59_03940 [Bdellovibrionales bacterium]|nr:hypothetical protein [Bdellovibrionales bacterium]
MLLFLCLMALKPQHAHAEHRYSSCCLCVMDDEDQQGTLGSKRECERWLSTAGKQSGCTYQETLSLKSALTLQLRSSSSSCEKLHIYGTYHGDSTGTRIPFQISVASAQHFSAKEVCYGGSSCLLFDNIDEVRSCSQELGQSSSCKFRIQANQNIGVVGLNCWDRMPQELDEASSKLTAIVDGLNFHLEYNNCSKTGDRCAFADEEWIQKASKDGANSKRCRQNTMLTTQWCCLPDGAQPSDGLDGRWGMPGHRC